MLVLVARDSFENPYYLHSKAYVKRWQITRKLFSCQLWLPYCSKIKSLQFLIFFFFHLIQSLLFIQCNLSYWFAVIFLFLSNVIFFINQCYRQVFTSRRANFCLILEIQKMFPDTMFAIAAISRRFFHI